MQVDRGYDEAPKAPFRDRLKWERLRTLLGSIHGVARGANFRKTAVRLDHERICPAANVILQPPAVKVALAW
jgi:hypothetical protein